jgi:hypothetical protein
VHDESADPPSTARDSTRVWVAWACFIVFILYPLSIGPAARLYEKGIARSEIEALYTPLGTLAEHSDVAQEILEWYLLDVWHFNP